MRRRTPYSRPCSISGRSAHTHATITSTPAPRSAVSPPPPSLFNLRYTKATHAPLPPAPTPTTSTRSIIPAFDPCRLQLFSVTDKLHLCSQGLGGAGGGPGAGYSMLYRSAIYRAAFIPFHLLDYSWQPGTRLSIGSCSILQKWGNIEIIGMFTEAPKNNMDLCEAPPSKRRGEVRSLQGASHRNLRGGGPERHVLLLWETLPKWFRKFGLTCTMIGLVPRLQKPIILIYRYH